jgi:hypothetical protein
MDTREQFITAQLALAEAEIDAGRTAKERIESLERVLKAAREYSDAANNRVRGGLEDPEHAPRAKDTVLRIEVALQKERMKPGK